ncbi:MAG: hypothetical protein M3237_05775 [Actinomycetota bacterium]|nr:hypothetical protein [Actinomycetota bacterium]
MGRGAAVRRILAAVVLVLLVAGCGSASDPSPPAGVDELVIPTPSPDPDDFVAAIDNPWLPLRVGATWEYTSVGATPARLAVTVMEGPTVAGVATTAVRSVTGQGGDGGPGTTVDYYAQDSDGNVWWFGREGEWEAGADGAEAGVAMLARPRLGDGYREAYDEGVVDQRAVITSLDDDVEVPAQAYAHVLVIETTSPAGDVVRNHYARGTGLVLREGGPEMPLELVAHDEPQS